eukprot:10932619-Alexandrium_andersonii.AAC.1
MSASLVGSEMCIRDRLQECLHARKALSNGANGPGKGDLLQGEAGVQPVSYTHLTLPTICSV